MADRLADAVAAIDAANAADPIRIVVDGVERPKELVHADAVGRWVRALDPDPSDAQVLAARAHHLRRWVVPRSDYPGGRAGYLRWRTDHKRRQAAEVTALLLDHGYTDAEAERVAAIVAKRGLGHDPEVQTHEDALCLAFVELQFDELAEQQGDDAMVGIVRKTLAKMSPEAVALAGSIDLSPRAAAIVAAALAAG